eukprot:TRINITY_DN6135_c0_g1_i6.p1 TRINITY_DN6135_c0_g1~~TRINITY_DN6135_c0_g1_i6.p1  ORF type:complete len:534 (+),score=111.72 TRINITY_DN6135_c0_g1_i6:87-1688(+)
MLPTGLNPNPNANPNMPNQPQFAPGVFPPSLLPTNNVIAAPPIITGTKLLPPGMPMMGMPPLGMPGLIPNDPTKGAAGAPGMLPPGAAANMLFPGFVLPGATPLMMTNAKPGFPLMNPMMNPFQPMKPPEVTKKVFVKNIPSDVPDTFMEDLLRECGHVISWKRTKNEQDKPVPFGYCEFETMEGVLKSMRLLNNVKLVDNQLQIKPAAQTELAIKEWLEYRKREWVQDQRNAGVQIENEEAAFEDFLERDDADALEKINEMLGGFDLNKVKEDKEREEEKKEMPKEREREHRKKAMKRDFDKKFREKLNEVLKREDMKERDRKRDQEREKEREREKARLLQRELNYDSDEEKKKRSNPKMMKIIEDRKKLRKKELEEDEMERRKEIQMQLEAERQAAENEPPLESIMPTEEYREAEEGEDTSMKAEKQAEPIPPPPPPPARVRKSRFSNPVEFIPPPENPPPPEEDDTVLKEGQGLDNVKIDLGANKGFAFKSESLETPLWLQHLKELMRIRLIQCIQGSIDRSPKLRRLRL